MQFDFQAVDGSFGVAQLVLVDERTLQGSFSNYTYSTTVPAPLRR